MTDWGKAILRASIKGQLTLLELQRLILLDLRLSGRFR
jgi:hypothetical protein